MWFWKRIQHAVFINNYGLKMEKNMDKGESCAALLTGLSKTFTALCMTSL